MRKSFEIFDPDECRVCGWKPAPVPPVKEGEKPPEPAIEDSWLNVVVPNNVVWLHICPKCGVAHGSKNAVENVKKLQEQKNSKIVDPTGPLALPKGPLVGLN